MKTAVGVMARAPLLGRCKMALLAAHSPEWVTGLYAAMLRDTLDGLQSISADDYLVFVAPVPPAPGEDAKDDARTKAALDVLERHVPAPWQLVAQDGENVGARVEHAFTTMFERGAGYALLSCSDAPSFPVDPLAEAFANEAWRSDAFAGPTEDGGYYVLGLPRLFPRLFQDIPWNTPAVMETTRMRCKELSLTLHELTKWYDVDQPSDVLLLLEEMRKHPERAPRTAQFLVTSS